MRALIVDDEALGRERIRSLLARRSDVTVAGEAGDGDEAVQMIAEEDYDVVFLDIQMPHVTGFEVIAAVGADAMPPVIFVTAYDKHALRAFEVHALDYLLKPVDPERFNEAVDRVVGATSTTGTAKRDTAVVDRIQALIEDFEPRPKPLERLMIKTSDHIEFVDSSDIDWIEAAGNYANLHVGNRSLLIRQTMKSLENRLDDATFMRIHRSTIVNINRIKGVYAMFNGDHEVRLVDGTKLTLSRGYKHVLDRFA